MSTLKPRMLHGLSSPRIPAYCHARWPERAQRFAGIPLASCGLRRLAVLVTQLAIHTNSAGTLPFAMA